MARFSWEPDFDLLTEDNKDYKKLWRQAMDWVRTEVDNNTIKNEFIKWAYTNMPENVNHLKQLPTYHFLTIGQIAYLINKAAYCDNETISWLLNKTEELLKIKIEIIDINENARVSNKDQKIFDYVNLYSFIDIIRTNHSNDLDELEKLLYDRLKKYDKSTVLKKLYTHYKDSLSEAINEKYNDLVQKTIEPLVTVVNVLANLNGNVKKVSYKGDRKSKLDSQKIGYKSVDSDTNSISLNPQQIPGMSTVVLYNSTNRRIIIYSADSNANLGIKGSKITGYNQTNSFAKTLRKPKEILQSIRNATNINRLNIILNDHVKGKQLEVSGKIGKDTLIIKVFK